MINNHLYLYDSIKHSQVYLDLKFPEIEFGSLDKIVQINKLTCIEVSNLYGEVVYVCDDDQNRILDLSDNIKVFLTSCKVSITSTKVENAPTMDEHINREKSELSNLLNKLQEAIKRKNKTLKEE